MHRVKPFTLERYFADKEFNSKWHLSSSDCESMTVPELLARADDETRAMWETQKLAYTEAAGHSRLRFEIAQTFYTTISPENILVGAPQELICIAMNSLLSPGDRVAYLSPAYQSLFSIAEAIGCDVREWRLQPKSGADKEAPRWKLCLDELRAWISEGWSPAMIVVNFPHNPTGFVPTEAEREQLLSIATETGAVLFYDEMYLGLEASRTVVGSAADCSPSVMVLSGLSKSFGLPGLRIGWLATQNPASLNRCRVLKDYFSICSSAPSEILAIVAVRNKHSMVDRCKTLVTRNLGMLRDFCSTHASWVELFEPEGGSTALVKWRGGDLAGGLSVRELASLALDRHGLMVLPGDVFGDAFSSFLRVGLGRENLPLVLDVFGHLLKELPALSGRTIPSVPSDE
jgi:aspartate/methionine/tyrosine aminotransferase